MKHFQCAASLIRGFLRCVDPWFHTPFSASSMKTNWQLDYSCNRCDVIQHSEVWLFLNVNIYACSMLLWILWNLPNLAVDSGMSAGYAGFGSCLVTDFEAYTEKKAVDLPQSFSFAVVSRTYHLHSSSSLMHSSSRLTESSSLIT